MILRYFPVRNPHTGERIRFPLLPITICCNDRREDMFGLIDSGSDFCVFSYSIAKLLNIDVLQGKQLDLSGFVGDSLLCYLHQVHLEFEELPAIDTLVAFTEIEQPIMPLLGQRGFFDRFQIRFRRYDDMIEIYPKSGSFSS